MMSKRTLCVVDLFSGCGGMSYGFRTLESKFRILGAVDLEKGKPGLGKSAGTSTGCNPTYARNIGVQPKNADVTMLSPLRFRNELGLEEGQLDVLISCAPCTGFSQKNARNHIDDDPRNNLIGRTADYVEAFMPRYLVMENVKELITGNQKHHFHALRARLISRGYSFCAEVHDLSNFGLPQRRIRALLIARRDGQIVGLHSAAAARRTVRDTIAHLPPIEAGIAHPADPMHVSPRMSKEVLDRIRAIPRDGGSWADIMNNPSYSEAKKRYLLIPAMFRARPGSFPDVYGRLWWERPAITITRECGHVGNGRYVHPEQDRLLTVREMALLQGFPATYFFEGRLSAKYNQIGDAVPPLISAMIAEHILKIESGAINVATEMAKARPQFQLFA